MMETVACTWSALRVYMFECVCDKFILLPKQFLLPAFIMLMMLSMLLSYKTRPCKEHVKQRRPSCAGLDNKCGRWQWQYTLRCVTCWRLHLCSYGLGATCHSNYSHVVCDAPRWQCIPLNMTTAENPDDCACVHNSEHVCVVSPG